MLLVLNQVSSRCMLGRGTLLKIGEVGAVAGVLCALEGLVVDVATSVNATHSKSASGPLVHPRAEHRIICTS